VTAWPGKVSGPVKVNDDWKILVRLPNEDLDKLAPIVEKLRKQGRLRVQVE
jgi:hypothetical protein